MLGQLAVVRAWVETAPGIQKTPGPHAITLLAHARAGGPDAAPVVAYLQQVGDADLRPPPAVERLLVAISRLVDLSLEPARLHRRSHAAGTGADDADVGFDHSRRTHG